MASTPIWLLSCFVQDVWCDSVPRSQAATRHGCSQSHSLMPHGFFCTVLWPLGYLWGRGRWLQSWAGTGIPAAFLSQAGTKAKSGGKELRASKVFISWVEDDCHPQPGSGWDSFEMLSICHVTLWWVGATGKCWGHCCGLFLPGCLVIAAAAAQSSTPAGPDPSRAWVSSHNHSWFGNVLIWPSNSTTAPLQPPALPSLMSSGAAFPIPLHSPDISAPLQPSGCCTWAPRRLLWLGEREGGWFLAHRVVRPFWSSASPALEKPALTQTLTSNLSADGSRNAIWFVGDGGGFGCRELMLFPGNLILPKSALC